MWDMIGELWIQTCITTSFRCNIFMCVLTLGTRKLQVVHGHCTYRMTALLTKMSIFCVRAGCEIRLLSYVSKHSSQFQLIRHLFMLTCNTWKLQVIHGRSAYRITVLLSETFLHVVWFRVAREIQLESYGPRYAPVVFSYIACVHCKLVHTSLFGMQLRPTTKPMYLWLHTTHQMTG